MDLYNLSICLCCIIIILDTSIEEFMTIDNIPEAIKTVPEIKDIIEDVIEEIKEIIQEIKEIEKINLMSWMKQSRSLLDSVYNFQDGFIDQNYVDRNTIVIEKQILIAGLRLASVLRETFKN